MKMCLVMILVKKVFIFSKTMIICLLCPLLCGLFFFWKGAKGELSYKSTEKRLKVRLYLSLLVYTVVGYGLTLILDYIFSKFDNGIFAWLYWRLGPLFILYLVIGFVCIFNYYWKKPWDYLDEAPDMPEQQKEKYVKVALDKAERLERLINELFEITKYNAHTVIIKKENVDLHCLIAQVIDEIYPTLSANGNTAVFTAEDNLSVNADPEKLARVFSNLLRNAASYSYPQTEITISTKRLEHDIQSTFENRGKTIPQEQLNSIFEKFNRLDDARLSNTGGAGLGLSIAEEIIHLHGGKITASSQNETIDFVITLPLSA